MASTSHVAGFNPISNRRRKTCGICGGYPVGVACYHICPNSVHYYSPEQEREDDRHYDPSEYYREGGFIDEDIYIDDSDLACPSPEADPIANDDIPF